MDQQCPGAVLFCKRPSALGPEEASAPSAPSSNTSDRLLHVEALYRTNAIPSFARTHPEAAKGDAGPTHLAGQPEQAHDRVINPMTSLNDGH